MMTNYRTTATPDATPVAPRRIDRRARDTGATPRGGRLVAWAGFVFGTILSVAMNWLHTWIPPEDAPPGWSPGVAPQIMSAVWPLCLLLSVEVLSRVHWSTGMTWALARYGGVGTVAAGSAVISYGHVHDVLATWGYNTAGSAVGPLVMDGLMIACGFAVLTGTTDHPHDGRVNIAGGTPDPTTPSTHPVSVHATEPDTAGDSRDSDTTVVIEPVAPGDTTVRDDRIRQMRRAGASTREIGREFGLHHSTIARIVAQGDDRDTAGDSRDTGRELALIPTTANGKETRP